MLVHFSGHLLFCHLKHVLHGVQTDDAFDSILRELCAYPVRLLIFLCDQPFFIYDSALDRVHVYRPIQI